MKYLCRWILARVLVDVKVVGFVGAHWISGTVCWCAVDGRGHADDGHAQIDGHQDVDETQKAARHRNIQATAAEKFRYEYQLTLQILNCTGDRRDSTTYAAVARLFRSWRYFIRTGITDVILNLSNYLLNTDDII